MAEHLWTILCSKRLVDPESQVLSLIDIGETIHVEGLEKQLAEAARLGKKGALLNISALLASYWHRSDPSEANLHIRFFIRDQKSVELLVQEVNTPWEEGIIFKRIFINLPKLPVATPGLMWILVQQQKAVKDGKKPRWATMTRLPLVIDAA